MTLRPFTINDAPIILSWIKDETAFRKWSNPSAFHCYESVGFRVVGTDSYFIDGEEWTEKEMEINCKLSRISQIFGNIRNYS